MFETYTPHHQVLETHTQLIGFWTKGLISGQERFVSSKGQYPEPQGNLAGIFQIDVAQLLILLSS